MKDEATFSSPPMHLDPSDIPDGLMDCNDHTGKQCARFALAQLDNAETGFPTDFFPKKTLVRCALLGSYGVHQRNYLYDSSISLRMIIEAKINKIRGELYIIAVLDSNNYYCLNTNNFTYSFLDELKQKTNSIDFVLIAPAVFGCFVFFEDSPACFMSFRDEIEFEKDFMPAEEAKSIFSKHMDEWRITAYAKERVWLERVEQEMVTKQIE